MLVQIHSCICTHRHNTMHDLITDNKELVNRMSIKTINNKLKNYHLSSFNNTVTWWQPRYKQRVTSSKKRNKKRY